MLTPLSGYYYDTKKNVFRLKSKIPKYVQLGVSLVFSAYALVTTSELAHSSYSPFTPKHSPEVKEAFYSVYIKSKNASIAEGDVQTIVSSTIKWAKEFELDEKLLFAIMYKESAFNKHAISNAGAFGLMQVISKYHLDKIVQAKKKLGTPEVFDIDTNIYLGAWVYKECIDKYKQNSLALRCYNGSMGSKTDYDVKVLASYNDLKRNL